MRLSDCIVDLLSLHGIDRIFGLPGESTLPLYASVSRHDRVTSTVARCQKCAGYMADAYARVRRAPAVCDAPGGIGSTLLPPALNEAFNSSTPLIAITAATSRAQVGRWDTSQCDQHAMLSALVKATITVQDASRIADHVRDALIAATSPRCGPVHLELPSDLLTEEFALPEAERYACDRAVVAPSVRTTPAADDVEHCLRLVRTASSPAVYAGGGVVAAGAEEALRAFATAWALPVATTVSGKGSLAEATDPCSIGVGGAKGHPLTSRMLAEADLLLLVGTKLGDKAIASWSAAAPGARVVQIDSDPREIGRNLRVDLALAGDARTTLELLGALTAERPAQGDELVRIEQRRARLRRFREARDECDRTLVASMARGGRVTTAQVVAWLGEALPADSILVTDAGPPSGWVGSLYATRAAGRRVIASRGSGSIGFGLPATIGAKLARPAAAVAGIGGDSGFAMASHELEVAVRLGLPIVYVVLNNQGMAMMNQIADRSLGVADLFPLSAPVRWAEVAAAYGCDSVRVSAPDELRAVGARLRSLDRPLLVEAMTPPGESTHDLAFAGREVATT